MKVSKRGEYGMRALGYLAHQPGAAWIHIHVIAEQEAIPAKFLENIMLLLKRGGFVVSRRGNDGGYRLARSADQIMLGDVMRSLDGPLAPLASAQELRELAARNPGQAGFYAVLSDVRDAVSSILDTTSLADVVARSQQLRAATPAE